MVLTIMKREWLRLKPSMFSLLMFAIIFTLTLFLVIGFPFYSVFQTEQGMKFMYWVAPGIWIFMSSFIAYFISLDGINSLLIEKRTIEAICSMPISNKFILIGILNIAIIIGIIQWVISFLFTTLLNNEIYTSTQLLRLFIQSLPSILFFGGLGIMVALITSNKFSQLTVSGLVFAGLGFGMGCFIPIKYFPEEIKSILEIIPITNLISGAHNITFQNPGSFTGGLFSALLGIVFILISFGLSNKRFRR